VKPIQILQTEDTPIIKKTKELCGTILEQSAYQEMKKSIMDFLQNEDAVQQYQDLCDKQELLDMKHHKGLTLTDEDVNAFQQQEAEFLKNPAAQGFISAQRQMHKIEQTVMQYVRKAFELNRVPTDADFDSGGCGPGCGCSH